MKPQQMVPAEVEFPCWFGSLESLIRHVVKHVIEGHEEQWQRIVGVDALSAARSEYAANRFGPACIAAAAKYQEALASSVAEACKSGRCHGHIAEYALAKVLTQEATAQIVQAWDPVAGLLVVARGIVRNDRLGTYKLQTGFRPWPKLGGKGFARVAQQRMVDRVRRRPWLMIAPHV